jgi:hypothetical protein
MRGPGSGQLVAAIFAVHVAATLLVAAGLAWVLLFDHALERFGAGSFGVRLFLEDGLLRGGFLTLAVVEHVTALALVVRPPAPVGLALPVAGEALLVAIWLAPIASWRTLVPPDGGPPPLVVVPERVALPWLARALWWIRGVLVVLTVQRAARRRTRPHAPQPGPAVAPPDRAP